MKLKAAIRYRLLYQAQIIGIFLIIWTIFGFIIPFFEVMTWGNNQPITTDLFIPAAIFTIIAAFIGINTDFKLFIQSGMSRLNIFIATLISSVVTSVSMSAIILIVKTLAQHFLASTFNIGITPLIFYSKGNFFLDALLLIALFLLLSSISFLVGIFNDIFSGKEKLIILAFVIFLPFAIDLFIQMGGPSVRTSFINFLKLISGCAADGMKAAPLILSSCICTLFFLLIVYLLNRKREIKRISE